jgi:hypothetical protein
MLGHRTSGSDRSPLKVRAKTREAEGGMVLSAMLRMTEKHNEQSSTTTELTVKAP